MIFENPKGRKFDLDQIVGHIKEKFNKHPHEIFKIIIGTDSQKKSSSINFISVIVVYRMGKGGTYFIYRERLNNNITLKQKIYKEAYMSLKIAQEIRGKLTMVKENEILELHVDIGEQGQTREYIKELVKYIEEEGFQTSIKPKSFAASKVADRHTKN